MYDNEQGTCPKCGGENLKYDAMRIRDDMAYYPYICEDCGQQGEEWYSFKFAGHNIYNGEDWVEL